VFCLEIETIQRNTEKERLAVNFINILLVPIALIFWYQKITKPKHIREKLSKALLNEKCEHKMLMKWAKGQINKNLQSGVEQFDSNEKLIFLHLDKKHSGVHTRGRSKLKFSQN
jgi:hypothetical protein